MAPGRWRRGSLGGRSSPWRRREHEPEVKRIVCTVDVGEPLEQPEWQVYDQLDPRYGPLAWLTFGEVIGSDVADQQGDTIGEIDALVRARADDMFYAVIETADAAADYVAIPVDQLKVVGETEAERQIVLADGSMEEFADYEGSRYQAASPSTEEEAQR